MNRWSFAVLGWIFVIFFSSTSLAAAWADAAFEFLAGFFWGEMRRDSGSYGLIHLLADKSFHVALFCVLAILLWKALAPGSGKIPAILLVGAVVGSCSEILQAFFPGRDPALRDVLINIVGTALGTLLSMVVSKASAEKQPACGYIR
ncbi:MAG TPA: VanZ family protein [Bryobacteraceae bacterium]|nr:VanZ family protein [Bryobacteraceae bacterium]